MSQQVLPVTTDSAHGPAVSYSSSTETQPVRTMDWGVERVSVFATLVGAMILGLLYSYITWSYSYWSKRNIPYVEPTFPFGNVQDLFLARIDSGRFYERFYKRFKSHKYGGVFQLGKPTLIVTDLDMVKQILTKDFAYFMDRALLPKTSHDFLAYNLFGMEGNEWKDMRAKLTPTFSSGKMKLMYSLIEKCSEQLKDHLEPLAEKSEIIDLKEVLSRYTLDIIATCAFGVEANTLADSNTDFFEICQLIFKESKTVFVERFFMSTFPRTANLLRMTLIDKRVGKFLLNLVETTVEYREKNHVHRNDFLDLLMKVKNNQLIDEKVRKSSSNSCVQDGLTSKDMAAQAFVFLAAGFETAASTTSFVLYELARHPEVQQRLRREVDETAEKHGGQITFQSLQEMTYMEQVVNETLRMYGSAPFLIRKCVDPYKIPNTFATLDKDVQVIIPSYAIHHDPEIYPDPEVFDPERFTEENVKRRHHYSFLPFGEGPRMCIGMRFGKTQVKAGLATIIANFELTMTPETPEPMEISPKAIITVPLHPIKLRITRRPV